MNEKTRLAVLRVLLVIVCVSHVVLGLAAIFATEGVRETVAASYGATRVPDDAAFVYILKPLGAYMLAVGYLAAAALYDPWRNRIVIDGVVLLLVLRVLQRGLFGGQAQDVFGIDTGHLLFQSAFFLALAIALFFFRPRGERPPETR